MTNSEFRALRCEAGLTQARVAVRAEVDRTRLCMWEVGDLTLRGEEVDALSRAINDLIAERAQHLTKLLTSFESRQVTAG